ncbi:MAG: hypothetical protein AAFP03_06830 [Cyanobacteria bacterium J06598_3]
MDELTILINAKDVIRGAGVESSHSKIEGLLKNIKIDKLKITYLERKITLERRIFFAARIEKMVFCPWRGS